jgi:hypothetical protein
VRAVTMFLGAAVGAAAHGAEPQMLAEDSWVCATPEDHDQAVAAERQGQDLQALEVPRWQQHGQGRPSRQEARAVHGQRLCGGSRPASRRGRPQAAPKLCQRSASRGRRQQERRQRGPVEKKGAPLARRPIGDRP